MSKLYVFGIGGTGSRVLRSLTMLLASGVECEANTIVPIIIDPDDSAANLTEAVESMKKYSAVRQKLDFTQPVENQFFRTELKETVINYRLPLKNTQNDTFAQYIGLETMPTASKALMKMLYSDKNLASDMKVGFKGNPNIGSIVLNQFAQSQELKQFANDFQQNDKIFIVSSIFGGTGASGFPLLLKTLRSNNTLPNFALINSANIGAITVLPYFNVQQDSSSTIDSATFISKTKSALSYYDRNISGNNSIDYLYYIGDDITATYQNVEGGVGQKNAPHIVEMLSALAILDFAKMNKPATTVHKEYGIDKNSNQVIFSDFGMNSQNLLKAPLTQFLLFTKYMQVEREKEYKHQPWAIDNNFDRTFFESQYIQDVKFLQDGYVDWLTQMINNKRSFRPFVLDAPELFKMVNGIEPRSMKCLSSNYALVDNMLNKQKTVKAASPEQRFMCLFYDATKQLVKHKFNF